MSQNTKLWVQANEIYTKLSELPVKQALDQLNKLENINQETKSAIISLIKAGGNKSSKVFLENFTPSFGNKPIQIFKAGKTLDEYELLEELGRGGMSQVFKAKRINSDAQRPVAIKIFAPKHSSDELLNHFLNEQKILTHLTHPHIIKMHHGGKTDDDITYLVMDLVEDAQDIVSYCKKYKLTTKQKIKYIAQCANALAYTHANLIIHRDLKPDNILINKDRELKIVDFGIAKLINNDITGNKTTIMALTPSYAAPEQVNNEQISVKSDIFSLAVVALDLLTDKPPLPDDRLIKSCVNDEKHIDNLLKSLAIDKDLKNILTKALENKPDARYSNMQSFGYDLNNWMSNKPVNATSQSVAYRIKKFAKRRSALFATMISFITFLFVGSFLGYQQYKQIKIEATKAESIKNFIIDAIDLIDPDATNGINITAQDILQIANNKINTDPNLNPSIQFEFLQTFAIIYGRLGQYDKAIDALNRSLEIQPNNSKSLSFLAHFLFLHDQNNDLKELIKKIDINSFSSKKDMARVYRVKAKISLSQLNLDQAYDEIELAKKTNFDKDIYETMLNERFVAQIKYKESKPQESIEILNNILSHTTLNESNTLILALRSDLAILYEDIGEFDLSLIQRLRVVKQQQLILGENHPELAKSLQELSTVYKNIGQLEKSEEILNKAYNISIKKPGEHNLTTASIINSKAITFQKIGNSEKAIEYFKRSIKIYEVLDLSKSEHSLSTMSNLSALYSSIDKNQESFEIIKNVYEIQKKKLGPRNTSTLYSQQILSRVLSDLERKPEAIKLAKLAVKNAQKSLKSSNNAILAGSYFTLATIYQGDKQHSLAIENFTHIIDKKLIDKRGTEYAILTSSIARLYQELKNFENSQKYYKISIPSHKKIFKEKHPRTLYLELGYATLLKNNNKDYQKIVNSVDKIIKDNNIEHKKVLQALNGLTNND